MSPRKNPLRWQIQEMAGVRLWLGLLAVQASGALHSFVRHLLPDRFLWFSRPFGPAPCGSQPGYGSRAGG